MSCLHTTIPTLWFWHSHPTSLYILFILNCWYPLSFNLHEHASEYQCNADRQDVKDASAYSDTCDSFLTMSSLLFYRSKWLWGQRHMWSIWWMRRFTNSLLLQLSDWLLLLWRYWTMWKWVVHTETYAICNYPGAFGYSIALGVVLGPSLSFPIKEIQGGEGCYLEETTKDRMEIKDQIRQMLRESLTAAGLIGSNNEPW